MKEYSSLLQGAQCRRGNSQYGVRSITGMSLRYFGPGEYPYKSILKETTCESAPYVLKNLGYSTHAIYATNEANFTAEGMYSPIWDLTVLPQRNTCQSRMTLIQMTGCADRNLTKYIMEALESSDDPDYIYTISVQGHGDYPEEPMIDDPKITVTGGEF